DKLKRAIRSYSKKDVDLILDTMESIADVRKDSIQAIEYIRLLRRYIRRNWKYIKPIGKRELPGIENYKGLGTFESNHRPFSYRMKKQGRAWSKKGAE
ncbi:ISLre2 family transposase, partial [Lactobacillus salivarius]|nr:ISLre2 family transposase [Ligilactobacillus salivarius]